VEIKTGKVRMAKAEGGGVEKSRRKEARRKRREEKEKEKAKERKKNRSTKDNRRVGDLEREEGGNKIRGRSKKASPRKIPQVDSCIWQKGE